MHMLPHYRCSQRDTRCGARKGRQRIERATEASADEVAYLEEAHAMAQNEIEALKTAKEQSSVDAGTQLQVAQELAPQTPKPLNPKQLKAKQVKLKEIAARRRPEADALIVRDRHKKKK